MEAIGAMGIIAATELYYCNYSGEITSFPSLLLLQQNHVATIVSIILMKLHYSHCPSFPIITIVTIISIVPVKLPLLAFLWQRHKRY